jgi:putative oxidoreductase
MPGPIPAKWGPRLLSMLRMVAAFLFMAHGAQKLFAWPASEPRETVALVSLMGLAGVLEFFGGIFLLLGLFIRPVAFLLAGEMTVAYAMAHAQRGFWPILNHGELAVLYCFLFLYLGAVGGGPWSLDALRQRPHRDPGPI